MNDKEIDDLLASDEENSPKASKETTKAPKSDSARSDGKVSSKDATGENGLSNGHSNGSDEKSDKSSEEKSKESEDPKDENGPSEEKSHNGVTEGQLESGEVEQGQTDENNKSETQKPDEETPKEEDTGKPAAKELVKKSTAESSQKSYQSITDLAEAETSDEDEEMEEDTTSPKGAAKGASSSDESGGGPKPFEPKVEVKAGAGENEATPGSPMETSPSDIKAKKEEEDSGSDEEKEEKKSSGKEETKEPPSGGVTAALVPVTADDDTDEDEDEEETNKPKENNKETTKAQEEEKAGQDATNKAQEESPKPKEKPDYAKGITEVVRIAQGVRALDQDDDEETSSGRKRASGGSEDPSSKTSSGGPSSEAKKPRTSAAATADNASKEEAVKKSLRKISRKELESIAAKRVVESLASRSELGQIRTRLQDLEDSRNKWMKKAQARGKMLQDLCTVVKRYIQDVESEKEGAKPIIITRSVGLQVVDAAAAKKVLVPATAAAQIRKPVGMTNGPRGHPHLQGSDRQSPQQQRALPVSNEQFRANHEVSVHRVPAGSAAGGRKVVSPAMVPQQAHKRPLAVAPGAP